MANSYCIGNLKNKIIKELIKDSDFINAIGSQTVPLNTPEKYIGTHIFDFNQNPNTINDVMTFIAVTVNIPRLFDNGDVFIKPEIEFYIVSHERHMVVDNIPKVRQNRNDYISQLLDLKFNGRSNFSIGTLKLRSNVEGTIQQSYLYRRMVFECLDLNDSLCDEDVE